MPSRRGPAIGAVHVATAQITIATSGVGHPHGPLTEPRNFQYVLRGRSGESA